MSWYEVGQTPEKMALGEIIQSLNPLQCSRLLVFPSYMGYLARRSPKSRALPTALHPDIQF